MIGRLVLLAASAAISVSACAASTDGLPTAPTPTSTPRSAPISPSSSPETSPSTPATPATSSASDSVSARPVPDEPLRTLTVNGAKGRVYAIKIWAEESSPDCAAHAYGEVAQFLSTHDCTGIRQVLGTTAINGSAVGFAQNSVAFAGGMDASYQAAGDFRELVTSDGTGNLNDLLREGYRLPAGPDEVPQPDAFSALGQDAGVVVMDAWFLDRATTDNDVRLIRMAEDLFLQL